MRSDGDHTNNIFRHFDTSYYRVDYSDIGMHDFVKDKTFLSHIKENNQYDNNEDLNFLVTYFNTNKFNDINVLAQQKELVDSILYRTQKLLNKYSAFSYFYVPILIFLLCVIEGQIVERETL
jgi:hypothetical protein